MHRPVEILVMRFVAAILLCSITSIGVAKDKNQTGFLTPVARGGQMVRGPTAAKQGAIGFNVKRTAAGFTVESVLPRGPAERAGIRPGDTVASIDGKLLDGLSRAGFYELIAKEPGSTLQIKYVRAGEVGLANVRVEARSTVYPEESKKQPALSQFIFNDGAELIAHAELQKDSEYLHVWFYFLNEDERPFNVDEAKFFILDGKGEQLRRLSAGETKYPVELWLAESQQNASVPPPAPPPPPRQYTITGSESGTYRITGGGSLATITGSSTGTYTVSERPDVGKQIGAGVASIAWLIGQIANRGNIKKAQETLGFIEKYYFRSESAILPGENRNGYITFWSGRGIKTPVRVILFLSDPKTGAEETVTFEFQ